VSRQQSLPSSRLDSLHDLHCDQPDSGERLRAPDGCLSSVVGSDQVRSGSRLAAHRHRHHHLSLYPAAATSTQTRELEAASQHALPGRQHARRRNTAIAISCSLVSRRAGRLSPGRSPVVVPTESYRTGRHHTNTTILPYPRKRVESGADQTRF
jgi:hypothetical protein